MGLAQGADVRGVRIGNCFCTLARSYSVAMTVFQLGKLNRNHFLVWGALGFPIFLFHFGTVLEYWLKLSFCLYERPFWFLRLAAQQWPKRFVHAPDFSSKSYSKSGSRNVRSALLKWHLSKTLLFCILNDLKENANVTTSGFLWFPGCIEQSQR